MNLIDFHSRDTRNLYFKIGERGVFMNQRTFLTVSLEDAAEVGDEIECEWIGYKVIEIKEEHPDPRRKGFIFQKLIIQRIR